jgi:hypothetical protein
MDEFKVNSERSMMMGLSLLGAGKSLITRMLLVPRRLDIRMSVGKGPYF